MRIRRGLLAVALAASLSIVWTAEAQASQIIVIPVSQWAYANTFNFNNGVTTDGLIGLGDPSPAAAIMRVGNDTTGNVYRGFLRFQLTGVSGQVVSVKLLGRVDHTWACVPRLNSFWRTAPIAAAPRQTWPGPELQVALGTELLNANEVSCGQQNMSFELITGALHSDIQTFVDAHLPAYYVGVSARDLAGSGESAQDRWMRYFLNDFRLQITFEPAG
ncbi:MAG TPA: hypothetical protein VFC19_04720 [Candidatus Limnocylindrales bacterium]|nr:hypothetical protein [Candidatus Limnocylindrales bacterium]